MDCAGGRLRAEIPRLKKNHSAQPLHLLKLENMHLNIETAKESQTPRRDWFFPLALSYLLLPNLIFLATWLRPVIGIPAAVICALGAARLIWSSRGLEFRPRLSRPAFCFVLGLAFFWTVMGGVGGVVPQSSDYYKHNLLVNDLVHSIWPVQYLQPGGEQNFLCYGLGYYLLPTLGGKLLGTGDVAGLTFGWTLAGLFLLFYWVATFNGRPYSTLVIFLMFAVTGVLWMLFKQQGLPGIFGATDLEDKIKELGLLYSYNDSFTRFQYQPQHALAGWLGAALLYERLWRNSNPRGVVFVWAVGLLWSPLSCLGLLLVPLAALRRVRWQAYFEPVNLLAGGLLLLVMGIYYQGHVPLAERGPIWKYAAGAEWLAFYVAFLALQLSAVVFIYLADRKYEVLSGLRPLFLAGAGWLVLLPLYKIGYYGDLRLQASAPALLFVALAAGHCWHSEAFSWKRPLFVFLSGSILIGAIYPLVRPWHNLWFNKNDCSYANIVRVSGSRNLTELTAPNRKDSGHDFASQYLGRTNSVAARWLLR